MTQTCAPTAKSQKQHCTLLQNVLTLLNSVGQSWTRLSNNLYQNSKPCLSTDNLRYLLKALNQTILRWKELTHKFKKLHKHSYFKLKVFWTSQQPPSLPLLIHQIIFYHNHTIYKLFTFFLVTFPFFHPSSFIFLRGGCDVWMVDGISLFVSPIFEFVTVSFLYIFCVCAIDR